MELVDLHEILPVYILPQGSFTSAFISDQRFEHGSYHVQLSRRGTDVSPWNFDAESVVRILFSLQRWVRNRLYASLPISTSLSNGYNYTPYKIFLILDRLS